MILNSSQGFALEGGMFFSTWSAADGQHVVTTAPATARFLLENLEESLSYVSFVIFLLERVLGAAVFGRLVGCTAWRLVLYNSFGGFCGSEL